MIEGFTFKPKNTLWLGGEFDIEFDCWTKPKIASNPSCRITKCKQIGFIVSHEYDIPALYITRVKRKECSEEGCKEARCYEFELEYVVSETIGVGFGLGGGTGTFGWKPKSKRHKKRFSTRCTCCDEELDELQDKPIVIVIQRLDKAYESLLSTVAAMIAFISALAISLVNLQEPLSRIFLLLSGVLGFVSLIAAILRHSTFSRRTDISEPSNKDNEQIPA